jgi:hypothetical protein
MTTESLKKDIVMNFDYDYFKETAPDDSNHHSLTSFQTEMNDRKKNNKKFAWKQALKVGHITPEMDKLYWKSPTGPKHVYYGMPSRDIVLLDMWGNEYFCYLPLDSRLMREGEERHKKHNQENQHLLIKQGEEVRKRFKDRKDFLEKFVDTHLDKELKKVEDKKKKQLDPLLKQYNELNEKGKVAEEKDVVELKNKLGDVVIEILSVDSTYHFSPITW